MKVQRAQSTCQIPLFGSFCITYKTAVQAHYDSIFPHKYYYKKHRISFHIMYHIISNLAFYSRTICIRTSWPLLTKKIIWRTACPPKTKRLSLISPLRPQSALPVLIPYRITLQEKLSFLLKPIILLMF